jgi:hypothetical protein
MNLAGTAAKAAVTYFNVPPGQSWGAQPCESKPTNLLSRFPSRPLHRYLFRKALAHWWIAVIIFVLGLNPGWKTVYPD